MIGMYGIPGYPHHYSVFNPSGTNSLVEYVASSQVVRKLAVEMNTDNYLDFMNTDQTDNVGRIIIDGVVDAHDYYSNEGDEGYLDTHKTLQVFFDSCYKAGPSQCSFYAPSPKAISQNLDKLYERIKNEPLPVLSRKTGSYGVVDHDFLRIVVFYTLLTPYTQFPALADGLAAYWPRGTQRRSGTLAMANPVVAGEALVDGTTAIQCNDGDAIPGTVRDAQQYFAHLSQKKPNGQNVRANIRISCSGGPNLEKYFRGPFVANTSHPMLLIGNTADPLTPLASAKKMSKGFPGSVVLTQDSAGRCSFSAPSVCTIKHVKAYFENGTLPAEGRFVPS
ncbi:hypothetical protein APHAL10511_007932 [Amanita phalloides]|nr:hypothetical protein APHAL10511_007932 [Amanita phalloides]